MSKKQAKAKVALAAKTTDEAGARIRAAIRRFDERLRVNSVGVYMEPKDVTEALLDFTEELQRVRQSLGETQWPTDTDYNEAGY